MITTRLGPASIPTHSEEFEDFVRRHERMIRRYLRLLGADEGEADDLL